MRRLDRRPADCLSSLLPIPVDLVVGSFHRLWRTLEALALARLRGARLAGWMRSRSGNVRRWPRRSSTEPIASEAPRGISPARLPRAGRRHEAYIDRRQAPRRRASDHQDGREVFSRRLRLARPGSQQRNRRRRRSSRSLPRRKPSPSTAVMMLMEEGKLVMDDPLVKFLPEWSSTKVAVANAKGGYDVMAANAPFTIRDLLRPHGRRLHTGPGPRSKKRGRSANWCIGWYFADKSMPGRGRRRDNYRRTADSSPPRRAVGVWLQTPNFRSSASS